MSRQCSIRKLNIASSIRGRLASRLAGSTAVDSPQGIALFLIFISYFADFVAARFERANKIGIM